MSSVVETSLRLAACAKRRIYEISPLTPLGRDDRKKKTVEMTGKEDAYQHINIIKHCFRHFFVTTNIHGGTYDL